MYELIFLGILPGTDIRITFLGWLFMLEGILLAVIIRKLFERRFLLHVRLVLAFMAMARRQPQV